MALRKTNNSVELNPHDGSIEQIVNYKRDNLGTGYKSKQKNITFYIIIVSKFSLNSQYELKKRIT